MEQNSVQIIVEYKGKYRNTHFLECLFKRYNLTWTLRKIHVDPYEIIVEISGVDNDIHDFIVLNEGWHEV
jgi:hypothetical protein